MPNSPQIPSPDPPFQGQVGRARHAAAAVPVRPDQRAALQQAPRRRRRDRPGHGQSLRSAARSSSSRSWPRRPATRATTATASRTASSTSAARWPRKYFKRVRRAARPRERSDRLPRLEGRLQPHVPGADGAGRHGDRAGAVLSRSTSTAVALASGNVIALEVARQREVPVEHRLHLRAPVPAAEAADPQLPAQSVDASCVEQAFFDEVVKLAKQYGFMVISDFAYADVAFDGYQPPSFLASPGAADVGVEFTTMSKGYNMAGWRVGFCSGNRRDDPGPGHDQRLLRLRHVPGDPDRRDHGPAAQRRRQWRSSRRSTKAAATCCATACTRIGWNVTPPKAEHVRAGRRSPSRGGAG